METKPTEIDKEVLKRALADPKSEERKQVGAWMIAKHKKAIVDMLRDAASGALIAHVNTAHQPSSTVNETQGKAGTDSE